MFQANTNSSLKNMKTQVGQLALEMQNQSKNAFPSDTKKNPKDCMVVTSRSGRELENRKEDEHKKTEKEKKEETRKETKFSSLELVEETEKEKVLIEQQVEKGKLRRKRNYKATCLLFHSLKGFKKQKWRISSLDSLVCSRR